MAIETRPQNRTNHSAPQPFPTGSWEVVSDDSRVGFRVKKMGLYHVKGRFREVGGTVESTPGGSRATVEIDAKSITTRIPPRDMHLRSAQFLDVEAHPKIVVIAERVESVADQAISVPATFEIRGQRRQVELTGHTHDSGGGGRLVLHLRGVIDRHDFGIRPPQPFEMVVGDEVELDVELALAAAAA